MPINVTGASRKKYIFDEFPLGTDFNDINAVYIYAKSGNGGYTPTYIGMSTQLGTRVAGHANDGTLDCALRNGADCFLVHQPEGLTILTAEARLEAIEKDLLEEYDTPCNTQHNT